MPLLLLFGQGASVAPPPPPSSAPAQIVYPQSTTLAEIAAADWSLELDTTAGRGAGSGLGGVVQGIPDVAQCIAIILTTPRGTDLLRPDFGCDLWQYIDLPITQSLAPIVRDVYDAIAKYEPRAQVIKVIAAPAATGAGLTLTVIWRLQLSGSTPQATTVTLGVGNA
jgi:phage baseplate assembly protein W